MSAVLEPVFQAQVSPSGAVVVVLSSRNTKIISKLGDYMRKNFIFQILILLLWASLASAETIKTKSGKIIEGDVIEKTDEYIKVQTNDQLWKIPVNQLDKRTKNSLGGLAVDRLKSREDSLVDKRASNNTLRKETIQEYRAKVAANPEDCEANMGLGTLLFQDSQALEATQYLKKAVLCKPNSLGANLALGISSLAAKHYDDAKHP